LDNDKNRGMRLLTILLVIALSACSAKEESRPNVVVIVSDDHRGDLLGCEGHPFIKTPKIDKFAGEGILFENGFCVAGVCSPSRATILTGKYDHKAAAPYIVWDNNSFASQSTFMKLLHAHGYYTGHIGKWHLGERTNHLQEGYDYWAGMQWLGKFFDPVMYINGEERKFEGFSDDIIASLAADFVRENAVREQPFCLYVGLKSPHMPFGYPDRLKEMYSDVQIPKPPTYDEDYTESGKEALVGNYIRFDTAPFGLKGWRSWQNYIRSYYRSATAIDDAVGTIVEAIDAAGITDNTIVLYTSDQGYNNGEHGLTEKHFAYEPVMNVPMVIRYPNGIARPGVRSEMVATIDIFPTLLDLCDVPVPGDVHGKSWGPLLEATSEKPVAFRDELMFAYNFQHPYGPYIPGQLAIRTEGYKLITYPDRTEIELYDLRVDPDEYRNQAYNPQYKNVLIDMKNRLDKLKAATEWQKRIRQNIESVRLLGPVPAADTAAVQERVFSDPSVQAVRVQGNTYEVIDLKGDKGIFPTGSIAADSSKYLMLVFEIVQDHKVDLFTEFNIRPFVPSTGYCNGSLFSAREEAKMGQCNPPLSEGANTVVFCLRWAKATDLELVLDTPGSWVYLKDQM
jgi:arylsulfatase A-like enzyme